VRNTVGIKLFLRLPRRFGLPTTKDEGTNAVRITKADQSDTVNEVHAGVATLALLHDGGNGRKDNVLHIFTSLVTVVVEQGNSGMMAVAVAHVLVRRFLFLFRHGRGQMIGKQIQQ
jgi:hypothetical protein